MPAIEQFLTRHRRALAIGLVLLALAVRVVYLLQFRQTPYYDHPILDAEAYDLRGWAIAQGDWVGKRIFYQDPLYDYVLGLVFAVFGHRYVAVYALQGLLGCGLCLLVVALASRIFAHSPWRMRVAWASGLLAALSPHLVFYESLLLKTSVGVFLSTAHLWALARTGDRLEQTGAAGRLGLAGAGLLLGLNLLNRGNYLLLAPLFALWLAWRAARGGREGWIRAAAAAIAIYAGAALAGVLPATVRNRAVGGEWVLVTSQGGQNFFIGNNPRVMTGTYEGQAFGVRMHALHEEHDFLALARRESGQDLTSSQASRYFFRRSLQWIRSAPADAFRLHLRKWGLFLMGFDVPDNYDIQLMARRFCPVLGWLPSTPFVLGPFAWAGALLALVLPRRWLGVLDRGRSPGLVLLVGFLLSYSLSIVLFFIYDRYRIPVFPALIILAPALVAQIAAAWRGWGWMPRLATVLALAAAAGAVYRPYLQPSWSYWATRRDTTQLVNLSTIHESRGELDRALALLRLAHEEEPASASVARALGRLLALRLRQPDEALDLYGEILALRPSDAETRFERAAVLAVNRRFPEAEADLERTLHDNPRLAAAELLLARVLVTQERAAPARAAYRRYLEQSSPDPLEPQVSAEIARALIGSPDLDDFEAGARILLGSRDAAAGNLGWVDAVLALPASRSPDRQSVLRRLVSERLRQKPLDPPSRQRLEERLGALP